MTTITRPSTLILAFLPLAALTGCALTAPAPGGPLQPGTTMQVQPSWALAYGPASATVGGTRVSANAQNYGGGITQGVPIPLRLGVRQAIGSAVEASADVGWLDSGAELRAGTPSEDNAWPFAVAIGVRNGGYPFHNGQRTLEGRARFELYPDISRAHDGSMRLTLSAGVGTGSFAHSLSLPESVRSTGGDSPDIEAFGGIVVRPETRLELGIGIYHEGSGGSVAVTLLPWILLHSDAPTKTLCSGCIGNQAITDFSQSWGMSLVITPSATADIIGKLTGGG